MGTVNTFDMAKEGWGMTSTSYHMCQSISGALRNWKASNWKNSVRHKSGRWMTPDEVKDMLLEELGKGRKVLPIGKCSNFDYQKGCLGHKES